MTNYNELLINWPSQLKETQESFLELLNFGLSSQNLVDFMHSKNSMQNHARFNGTTIGKITGQIYFYIQNITT